MSQIDEKQLIDYLHRSLSSKERTQVEAALREDDALRTRLTQLRALQNDVRDQLSAEINQVPIPASMTFDAIIADVHTQRRYQLPIPNWLANLIVVVSVLVFGFAFWFSLTDSEPEAGAPTPTVIQTEEAPALDPVPADAVPTCPPPGESDSSIPTRNPCQDPDTEQGNLPADFQQSFSWSTSRQFTQYNRGDVDIGLNQTHLFA